MRKAALSKRHLREDQRDSDKEQAGPAPGSTPKENTVGNMASPASIETQISAMAILRGASKDQISAVK